MHLSEEKRHMHLINATRTVVNLFLGAKPVIVGDGLLLGRIAHETGFEILELRFCTSSFILPRSLTDIARGSARGVSLGTFGPVGGQALLCVLKRAQGVGLFK